MLLSATLCHRTLCTFELRRLGFGADPKVQETEGLLYVRSACTIGFLDVHAVAHAFRFLHARAVECVKCIRLRPISVRRFTKLSNSTHYLSGLDPCN